MIRGISVKPARRIRNHQLLNNAALRQEIGIPEAFHLHGVSAPFSARRTVRLLCSGPVKAV
jgi:hypothetical protein